MGYYFLAGVTTVLHIVPDVANPIWDGLVDRDMPMPREGEWRPIAQEFMSIGSFLTALVL